MTREEVFLARDLFSRMDRLSAAAKACVTNRLCTLQAPGSIATHFELSNRSSDALRLALEDELEAVRIKLQDIGIDVKDATK